MARTQTYEDRCGIARALDLVGERWALLVVRELLLGPKRFTDLRSGLPKVSAEVLGQRLRDLELAGLVVRRTLPPPGAVRVYELTGRGAALEPVLLALGRWGSQAPLTDAAARMSVDSHVIALKTLFVADTGDVAGLSVSLTLGEQEFDVQVRDLLDVRRGRPAEPDLTITAEPQAFLAVLRGRRTLDDAVAAGELAVEGRRADARRFFARFPARAG